MKQRPEFPDVGSRVRVVRGISESEKRLLKHPELVYTVIRYTDPHGWAVIQDEWNETWHVHPEALEAVGDDIQDCPDCGHRLYLHRRQASGAYRCKSSGCGCERA